MADETERPRLQGLINVLNARTQRHEATRVARENGEPLPAGQVEVTPAEGKSVHEMFEEFHRENPDFYTHLVKLARQYLLRTGNDKVGVQRLIEIARWDLEVQTGGMDFKVNNNFGAYYARLIAFHEPDLVDAFTMRRSDEADEWARGLGGAA